MKIVFLFSSVLLCSAVPGYAMQRPSAEQIQAYRADGSLQKRVEFAAEIGNNKFHPGAAARLMYKLRVNSPAGAAVSAPPPAWRGMPTAGTPKIFALLVEFSDYPHAVANSSTSVNTKIFGAGAGDYPYESLKSYYSRSSYGLLAIQGSTLGWYTAFAARSSISTTTAGRENLIKEAINYFEAQGHDFAQYDNDGDGVIDYFAVIWAGPDNGWGNFWWGYQTTFTDVAYTVDGKKLGDYSWQWESRPNAGTFWPLVLIHETGHALGLPDYYDYDPAVGPDGGVGGLDMMDSNIGDHNAFSKFMLGWLSPVNVPAGSISATLRQSDSYPDAVKVMPSSTAGGVFEEFFMLQNRVQSANDQNLPGNGIVIWHVDARLNGTGQNFLYDNSYTAHKLLRLMEADGLEEIENGDGNADAGDFYVPLKEFNASSSPNSNKYDGSVTKVFAENIGGTTASRTLDCGAMDTRRGYVTVMDNLFKPLVGGKCRLDVTTLSAGNITIKAYTLDGGLVRTIYNGPVNAGALRRFWDGKTDNGNIVASGLYLIHVKGPNTDEIEKVVVIK